MNKVYSAEVAELSSDLYEKDKECNEMLDQIFWEAEESMHSCGEGQPAGVKGRWVLERTCLEVSEGQCAFNAIT